MGRKAILAAALLLAALGACSEDGGPGDGWQTAVVVKDGEGNSVEGLDLMILMDSPFYQDGLAAKAAVQLRWYQPVGALITMTIEDAAGATVRNLWQQFEDAGSHTWMWNGVDDDGSHVYSGLYYAHLTAHDAGDTLLFDASAPMFLAMMDFDQATIGTTDADGRVILTDRTVFPHLFGDPGMVAVDENGDPMGEFPLTSVYRFYLRDPRYGHGERVDVSVTGTEKTIELPWMGVDAAAARIARDATAAAPGPVTASDKPTPPQLGFIFYGPMPNPFN